MPVSRKRKFKPKRNMKPAGKHVMSNPGKNLAIHMSYIPKEEISGDKAFEAMMFANGVMMPRATEVIMADFEKYGPMIAQGTKFEVIPKIWVNVDEEQAAWNRAEVERFCG